MDYLYKLTFQKILFTVIIISAFYSSSAQTLQLVKDINTTGFNSSSFPFDFNILNGKLYFLANDNSGVYGLWSTSGTTASTIKITPSTGDLSSMSDIIVYHNKIYFAYNNGGNDYELWASDGTVAGTKLFKDIYPGNTGSFPHAFTVANDKLFFMANNTNGERRLYVSDGTSAGTIDIKAGVDLFNGFTDFAVYNNNIYFTSDDGSGSGYGLWKSDGTVSGTALVYSATKNGFIPGVIGSNYAVYKNKMYFSADDLIYGSELWVTDGTAAGTHIVINLKSDDVTNDIYGGGNPYALIVYNGELYFSGTDDAHGSELFKTDGTAAGTQVVKDIVPGTEGSNPYKDILYNGYLYFFAGGDEAGLYKTDGTSAGTVSVKTGLNGNFAGVFNNKLYTVQEPSDDYNVWQSDGTTAGTKPIALTNTTNPVSSQNNDFKFIEYNSEIYLSASNNDITVGTELCKITNSVLAVNLLSFTGTTNGTQDVLSWITADENNTTANYIIQKSTNGISFSPIGTIKATDDKTGNSTYNFKTLSSANTSYYKLQIKDKDGSNSYSSIIKLQRNENVVLKSFYNANSKRINIINNTNSACVWRLYSNNGSIVKSGNSFNQLIQINSSGIAPGVYILSATAMGKTINVRIAVF